IQSLKNLKQLHPGFETENLLTFAVEPTLNGYKPEWALEYYRRLIERLKTLPGVTSVALAVIPVLGGDEWDNWVTVEGYTAKQGETVDPHMQFASPGFVEKLQIPVLLRHDFTVQDAKADHQVRIVNERF